MRVQRKVILYFNCEEDTTNSELLDCFQKEIECRELSIYSEVDAKVRLTGITVEDENEEQNNLRPCKWER